MPPFNPENWIVDPEKCIATHENGLAVRFDASDLLPNAVIGEIVTLPAGDIDLVSMLRDAGTAYAASRAGHH